MTAEAEPLIRIRDLRKVYPGGDAPIEVLKGISLDIHAGEFVAIMGASGSGKSTLMNVLGCLDRPTSGEYRFAGREVSGMSADDLAWLRREAFGFIFQSYHLLAHASACGNVEIPAIYAGLPAPARRARAKALLERLGLGERLDHRPNQLSGGQQQRVSIARALMNGGHIILADEPTGALDSRSGADVMALLRELAEQGHTIILITHDREVAAHACRRIELRDGEVVADTGTPADVLAKPASKANKAYTLPHRHAGLGSLIEALGMALRALRANLFRTALTLLGVVIGVGSVVAMLAVGEGARQAVLERISAMGTNLLLVRSGAPGQRGGGSVTTLVPADAEAIMALDNVLAAVPELSGSVTVRVGNLDTRTDATATSAGYPEHRNWPVAEGAFFTDEDIARYATVVALGRTVANHLFPDEDPVGRFVLVNNVPFMVTGIMANKGATFGGQDADDTIFVPLTTGGLRLFGQTHVRAITVAVDDTQRMDETQERVAELLRQRHGQEDFQIRNMASILETATETQNTLTLLLGSIAAISLLVGGIGVMNIMLVSVTERTREIGIRMATGARTGDILAQFLTEAVVVSVLGGALGIAAGIGSGWLLFHLAAMPIQFSSSAMLLAFGCAAGTGLIFGFAPALKAARLDPVVALGSE